MNLCWKGAAASFGCFETTKGEASFLSGEISFTINHSDQSRGNGQNKQKKRVSDHLNFWPHAELREIQEVCVTLKTRRTDTAEWIF